MERASVPLDFPADSKFPPILLFYHTSMKELAFKIDHVIKDGVKEREKKRNDETDGGDIRQYRRVQLMEDGIEWGQFRDGWPNIMINNVQEIAGRDVIFLASLHSPDTILFEQLSVMYAFPRYLVRSFRVILPFFPTATMERIDKEGQVVTAKTLALMLSTIPLAARGPTQLVVFDIHALQERFYFSNQVIPRLLSAIPLLKARLEKLPICGNISIAFPDDGAFKRFNSLLPTWPTIICNKIRDGEKRIVTIKDGVATGRDCVIVDDLVQTGGTLMECAKALQNANAKSISLFVTHAVFPKSSWKKFTAEECEIKFSHFWITDSIPHAIEIATHKPFELLSLCDSISNSLFSYDLLSDTQ